MRRPVSLVATPQRERCRHVAAAHSSRCDSGGGGCCGDGSSQRRDGGRSLKQMISPDRPFRPVSMLTASMAGEEGCV